MQLTDIEKGLLLKRAREAINSLFTGVLPPVKEYENYPALLKNAGAFVTMTENGSLRGCIGFLSADHSLINTVTDAAVQAAKNDPRFIPLQNDELDKIELEISVLSPPASISDYSEIEIGKHGLILDHMGRRAVLLPQVAVDHNMDVPMFLDAICEKGGFYRKLWKEKQLDLKVFTASVFSENPEKRKEQNV